MECVHIAQAFMSKGAFVKAMKDRFFQFWLKFWCATLLSTALHVGRWVLISHHIDSILTG